MHELAIKGGRVLLGEELVEANLYVRDGKISSISKRDMAAEEVIDARGAVVLPGAIDVHAHVHPIGYLHREDFLTGSRAAAAGGVTTIFDMPLMEESCTAEGIKRKIQDGERMSIVDFAIHAGTFSKRMLGLLEEPLKVGVGSYKAFTCPPFELDSPELLKIFRFAAEKDVIVVVHSEDGGMVRVLEEEARSRGSDFMDRNLARPPAVEEAAVLRTSVIARFAGARYHVAHVTSLPQLRAIEYARSRGTRITAETCIHYLVFTREDVRSKGPYLTMNPPLKSREDREALWRAIVDGAIEAVTTDHAPGTREEKEKENAWEAWGGVPGLQELPTVVLSEGTKRGIPIPRLSYVLSEGPARAMRIYPKKGSLLPGSDADILIWRPNVENVWSSEAVHYKTGWTPYEGMTFSGRVEATVVRGRIVFRNGEILERGGWGRFVRTYSRA